MQKRLSRILALAMGILLLLGLLAGCGAGTGSGTTSGTDSTTIKVATDFPVSGGDASIGKSTENGAALAVKQANDNKTIPGYTLQFVPKDDVGVSGVHDPAKGANNVTELISDALVAGIVGPFNSNVAQREMPITNNAPIALISPSNTNPCLTKVGPAVGCTGANDQVPALRPTGKVTYFRLAATDDHQGPAMADYLYKQLKYRKAYVIDDTETYGVGIAKYFVQEWKSLGGTVVDDKSHSIKSTTSYAQVLDAVAVAHPDVVYFGGVYANGGTLIRKQMEANPALQNTAYAGGDGIQDISFAQAVGESGGPIFATVAAPDASKIASAQTFVKDYKATYGSDVGPYSATAYDAMNILIQAIKVALTKTHTPKDSSDNAQAQVFRQAVIDALKDTSYNGATGHTSFDENGDTTNKLFTIYQVASVNGKPDWAAHAVVTVP
ncbi:MAG: branched-chain amino acid ABC transporter substrate-binding protein [Chloroflexi bacterium]|nr:branched-chain amino acid ABC transporter substrate-binding protein [Ktedonobacteraceae bacterium]MBV9708037.1 branched-chain amino acid ABC transporter substrate-binding protein [Chloroflexota bacterium]